MVSSRRVVGPAPVSLSMGIERGSEGGRGAPQVGSEVVQDEGKVRIERVIGVQSP